MAQEVLKDPIGVLQSVFGYPKFRPLQEEAIGHVLNGGDALVILPTGGGKSLCYQVPALVLPGLTVVISPLIALMRDQVEALKANGVAAAALNSGSDAEESREALRDAQEGRLKLLYVSPEKALSAGFAGWLATLQISLFAIDEAHCVSVWGNDFRPEYARLTGILGRMPQVPVLALTATADPATRADIVEKLRLRQPGLFLGSFERHNLFLEVQPAQDRVTRIQRFLQRHPGQPGIVYCLSRNGTESLAERLAKGGIRAAAYHAGLAREVRHKVQEAFQKDDLQVVCATIAFGMGIDKSNIRWVVHYNLPRNIESYYQEIGRAGRDGAPAETLLFAGYGDVITYREMIAASEAAEEFKDVQHRKLDRMFDLSQAASCRTNLILGYFGESRGEPCGHCDNCQHPPETFDGTVIAQKALSALRRTGEKVGVQLLADILRGAMHQEIRQYGYERIKTFGSGRDISRTDWLQYITQLINLGVLNIDYAANSRLRVSSLGEEVLFQGRSVALVRPAQPQAAPAKAARAEKPRDRFRRELLLALTAWRKEAADREGISPSNLLSDKVLQDLTEGPALFHDQLEEIAGMTAIKRRRHGADLLRVIRKYVLQQDHVRTIKGLSSLLTLQALEQGVMPAAIAAGRNLSETTINSHAVTLCERGEDIDLDRFVPLDTRRDWLVLWERLGRPAQLAPLMEHLSPSIDMNLVRLVLASERKGAVG